jgi:tight adherence protein C
MSRVARLLLSASIVVFVTVAANASPAEADDGTRIAITQLDASSFPEVRLIASLSDAQGRGVRGIDGAEVVVTENGVNQSVKVVPAAEAAPIALALVLDTSGSMAGRPLSDAKRAMTSLVGSLGPGDQAAVITFSATVKVAQPLTSDKALLGAATQAAVAGGDTAIYDALASATGVLGSAPPHTRRAIVLLTDGVDNASRADRANTLGALAAQQLPAYVVGLGADLDRAALAAIGGASPGGRFIEAPSSSDLAAIYAGLGEQLLTQFAVTYRSSTPARDDASVAIEVTLRRAGAIVATAGAIYRVPVGRGVTPETPAPAPTVATVIATAKPQTRALVPRVLPLDPVVIGLLGAATVLTLLLWISELASRYPSRQRRRLETFVRGLSLTAPEHAKRRSLVQRILVPSLRTAGRPLLRVTPTEMIAATRDRLRQAGEPMGLGPVEFLGVRVGFAFVGAIVGLIALGLAIHDPGATPYGGLAGILLGYAIPGFFVDALGRGRRAAVRRALPAALDMLALSAEAGLSFDGAIGQVAHRWNTPLSDEFRAVLLEFQMGRDRRDVLRELAQRTGVPELARFAGAVTQADSLGVPLSRVLHEQSTEIRMRRRQRAEELARKAPVKMLFPMVFLIFPALFVVILGPAVPRLLSAFQSFK